jgi:hypothetical protein
MRFMDESEFVAHALRDYLRPLVEAPQLRTIDWALDGGEPIAAISSGLGIAQHYSIALPSIFQDKVLGIEEIQGVDREAIEEQFASLPVFWQQAS